MKRTRKILEAVAGNTNTIALLTKALRRERFRTGASRVGFEVLARLASLPVLEPAPAVAAGGATRAR